MTPRAARGIVDGPISAVYPNSSCAAGFQETTFESTSVMTIADGLMARRGSSSRTWPASAPRASSREGTSGTHGPALAETPTLHDPPGCSGDCGWPDLGGVPEQLLRGRVPGDDVRIDIGDDDRRRTDGQEGLEQSDLAGERASGVLEGGHVRPSRYGARRDPDSP